MLPVINHELTKSQIKVIAQTTVNEILDGGKDIVQISEMLTKVQLLIKEMKDSSEFNDALIYEVTKFGRGYVTPGGTKMEVGEFGTKYDFSKCGDLIFDQLEQQQKSIDEAVKERKEFLKKVPSEGMQVLDSNSGEVITIYPPSKSSSTSVKFTIQK